MEEKVKVRYQGRNLEATKSDDKYEMKVPANGSKSRTIYNFKDGWTLVELDSQNPEYYFWIRLREDGRIEFENNTMEESQVSDGRYSPEYTDMGEMTDDVRELYYASKQLEGHQRLGVSPIEMLELRYKMMWLTLKMLGYQNESQVLGGEPNPDISVMDLNHVIEFIENYPAFGQYVTKAGTNDKPTVDVHIPDGTDKEQVIKRFEEARKSFESETEYYNSRMELLSNVRHPLISPEFGMGMKNAINPNNWETYSNIIKRLGKEILSFNADLLPISEKMRIIQGSSLTQAGIEHQISLITHIPEMDQALDIESDFFIDQIRMLHDIIQKDLEDERTRNSTPGKLLRQFGETLDTEAEDRKKAIQNRNYYRNIYPYDKNRKKIKSTDDDYYDFGSV